MAFLCIKVISKVALSKTLLPNIQKHYGHVLTDCIDNYIGIGIDITRTIRCCNVIFITIHLFGDNTKIEH